MLFEFATETQCLKQTNKQTNNFNSPGFIEKVTNGSTAREIDLEQKMAEKQQYNTFGASREQLTAEQTQRKSHKVWFLSLIILNVLVLVVVFILNGLSAAGPSTGVFESTPGNQSDKYYLEITPAGWTFSIWGFIYTFQALWVLYSVVNLFRKTPQGSPVYLAPEVLPPALFILYILANCSNIAWLFLFDRDHIEGAFVALFLISAFLIVALAATYRSLDKGSSELVAQNRVVDIWLVRGIVHNGLAIYATWTSIATLLNLAMVITYSSGSDVSVSTASTVALGVLTAEIAVFVATDLVLLDKYSRYTFTPYIVVVVALIGSISKNWEAGATNSIFTAVLLGLGSLAFVVKIVLSIYRHLTRPPYVSQVTPTLSGKNMA